MKEPTTTLDTRFSDPGAVATEWQETRRMLETAELFWISTVRPDGRPHVTPLVAVWLDEAIHFCTGATEQKAINLSRNPHVILTTGCNQWKTGIDVVVEGAPSSSRTMTRSNASRRLGPGNGTDSDNMRCATARFTTKTAAPHSCSPLGPRRSWRLGKAPSARQVTGFEFLRRKDAIGRSDDSSAIVIAAN